LATQSWRGDAPAVAQINTWTLAGTWLSTDTVTCTINGKAVATVTGSSTIATLIATVQTALAASAIAEFKEILWTNTASTIVATAATAGVPFAATLSTGSAAGTINGGSSSAGTATAASAGPADASTAANWSSGSLPTTGDDIVFAGTSKDCLYGLTALAGITSATLTIDMSYSGKIGLPYTNPSGYIEYRSRYLKLPATLQTLGNGPGAGSGRINLDSGSVQTTLSLNGSASPVDTGFKTVNWKGTHAANVVNLNKGSFAAAPIEGETASVAAWNQGYQNNQAGDVDAYAGGGATLTTINKTGGSLTINSSFTTLNHGPGNAGECIIAAGTPGTLTVTGGNYTALTTTDSGYVDFSQDSRAITGTSTTCNPGSGSINDPGKRIMFTNPVLLTGQLSDYPNLNLGSNFHVQRS
jgi:hypothetical protein